MVRSPYKMAGYNIHGSPQRSLLQNGNPGEVTCLFAVPSNAGLADAEQHPAVSLIEITLLLIECAPVQAPVI